MNHVLLIRIILIVIGVVLLGSTIFSLAKRVMTESLCLVWGILSMMFVFAGITLRPVQWVRYISTSGSLIIFVVIVCVIWCSFFITMQISVLRRKNQELAMQISLINQENQRIKERLAELEKNIVCD